MKSIACSFNVEYIKSILGHRTDGVSVYESVAYDNSPLLIEYVPKGIFIVLYEDNKPAGFINFEPLNNIMWQCHIFVYVEYRKNNSEQWGELAKQFIAQLGAKKLLAITPYENARKYAERIGFVYLTTLDKSICKNGKMMDQYLLEINL